MIMAAEALLAENPNPTREDVVRAISGNVCRCTGYEAIIDAILDAADAARKRHERHDRSTRLFADATSIGNGRSSARTRSATSPAARSSSRTSIPPGCCT